MHHSPARYPSLDEQIYYSTPLAPKIKINMKKFNRKYYADYLDDYEKLSNGGKPFTDLDAIISKHKKTPNLSSEDIEEINETTLWLHRWIRSRSIEYENHLAWEKFVFDDVYNEMPFPEDKKSLEQSVKNIAASTNLLRRHIDFLSDFTLLGVAMEKAYEPVKEKIIESEDRADEPLKDLLKRRSKNEWVHYKNEVAVILPLIEAVAREAILQITKEVRRNGRPPKVFRDTTFTAWHRKIERELHVSGKEAREISISSWNIYFPSIPIIDQDTARKIIKKHDANKKSI